MERPNTTDAHFNIPEESHVKEIMLAEQTGGNIFLDTIKLKNGKLIVISSDVVSIYKNERSFDYGEELSSYVFE